MSHDHWSRLPELVAAAGVIAGAIRYFARNIRNGWQPAPQGPPRRIRHRADWLYIGKLELDLFGHLTEETRQKVARLWATGDQAQRTLASALLDQESFMHAGHERLAKIEELAAKIQMLDLKEKLANPSDPPPWPVPEWRH